MAAAKLPYFTIGALIRTLGPVTDQNHGKLYLLIKIPVSQQADYDFNFTCFVINICCKLRISNLSWIPLKWSGQH